MKKILLLAAAALMAAGMVQAKTAEELRIYLNPGHGSYGPNDRPMSTVNHPGTKDLADTDTLGFYEGRGTLQRAFGIATYLKKVGVKSENIVFSRLANGPFPYNASDPDEVKYEFNRDLAEICEEVEAGNFDMFISDHSNANTDGDLVNYPLFLFRGYDNGKTGDAGYNGNAVEGSYDMANTVWDTHYMSELDPQSSYSLTSKNLRGDINFYGSYSTSTRSNGNSYSGYLGVLKHGVPGFLLEGFFHTYQPARHRALNFDYDRQEGRREARGVGKYFGLPALTTGDIMGHVRDLHEKFSHTYYKPAPGTDDALLPLNGAVVKLYKNGTEVGSYDVDNEYNGIFVFEDLEPGDYTLDVTLEGYKPLFDEYKTPITVTADKTSYAKLYLENEDYVPDSEVYVNYPDPDQPDYLALASEFNFDGDVTANFEIVGQVTDVAQLGDSTVILSNDGLTPHLYLINAKTQELIKELSVEGIYSEQSTGFYSPLYSIAFTADHKLVGVSHTRNQYSAGYVDDGYTRGTSRLYIWDDIDQAPALWGTTMNSGNYYRADVGQSIAINGPSKDCQVLLTAVNRGASPYNIRLVHLNITDGEVVSVFYDNLYSSGFTAVKYGDDMEGGHLHLAISPNSDDKAVLGGSNGLVTEFNIPTGSGGSASDIKQLSAEFDLVGYGFSFFRYAKHSLMVAPYTDGGTVKGVRLLDVTNGLDKATLIKTNNTDLTDGSSAPRFKAGGDGAAYDAATASVQQTDINLFLAGKTSNLTRFTTEAVEQPLVKGIYAYGLNSEQNADKSYTFTFTANSDAVHAYIVFTDADGNDVGRVEVPGVTEGVNTITITQDQLPGQGGDVMNWAVNLVGNNIPNFALINNPADFNYSYTFNTVDNSPESDYFGRIYIGHRPGNNNAANGLWIYNPDYTLHNSSVIKSRTDGLAFRSNYRLGIDAEGKVYMPDWGDPTSGVYVFDPANEAGGFYPFFANDDGTPLSRNGDGLLTNASGQAVAGSSPGVNIAGSGADTKLFVYNEDLMVNGRGNNVSVYNIGTADGPIAKYWNQPPDKNYAVGSLQLSTNGNIIGRVDGSCWVAQNRSAGNNDRGVPSLIFVDPDGNVTFNSGADDHVKEVLNGSSNAGFAVTRDEKTLVINDGSGNLQFFDVTFAGHTPTLTHKYSYRASAALTGSTIYQMNYDYAGNLIASGGKVGIYAIPTEDNQSTVPAKRALLVEKEATLVSITLNHTTDENIVLTPGETLQLEVIAVDPETADKSVTWSSSDESVATVDANGLVTAVPVEQASPARKAPSTADLVPVTITAKSTVDPTVSASVTINVDYTATGVQGVNAGKQVVAIKYVNTAGIQSDKPFEGVNIVVTTYDDGSQQVVKVVK